MKPVFCFTDELWKDHRVMYVNSAQSLFPANWKGGNPPPQKECKNIDEVKAFAEETKAGFVMFGFRASGIPIRPVEITKADRPLQRLGRILDDTPMKKRARKEFFESKLLPG